MELRPVDLIGGFYADDSKPWSVQDTVNWLPEVAEVAGTRTQMKLASPPGLREFMRLGDRPIRGLRNVEGQLFAVCGNDLHQISTKATSTVRGQIPGVGRVQMAHNQITGGNELLIVNGQSTGYVWNTAKNTYLRITDDGYPGARAADYLDSYLLQVEPFGRFWFHSNLANALDYNTLDRYESEASPDKIVTLVVSQFEVIVFNETTTEFFYNAGTDTNTFQNKRVLIDRGCASGDTVQKLDNSVFWLGNDGVVYRLNGYQAVPISTGPMQAAIRVNNWKQAFAFTWEDGKHKVYYLTFPDGKTWGYDVVTGVWHRRASFGLDRWRLNHLVRWNGMWIGSDFQDGRLWILDWDYMLEGDQPLVSERIGPVGHNNQMALSVNYAELMVSMGLSQTLPTADEVPIPVVYVGSGSTFNGLSSQAVVTPPANLELGDLMVAAVMSRSAISPPSGWKLVGQQGPEQESGTGTITAIYSKFASTSDLGSEVVFSAGASTRLSLCVSAYRSESGPVIFNYKNAIFRNPDERLVFFPPQSFKGTQSVLHCCASWVFTTIGQHESRYSDKPGISLAECTNSSLTQDNWLFSGYAHYDESDGVISNVTVQYTGAAQYANGNCAVIQGTKLPPRNGNGEPDLSRKVEICYSKDGGYNWSNWREYSLGELGEYSRRIRINRLGRGRQWVFKIRVSSPVKRDLYGAVAYIEPTGG